MKKAEIDRKFDEIVAFSEVEKFIDTPVKRYSSGMFVRLAFAVAAHLEPEILIVDEVLAVGDARFQKKCLSKMEEVGHQGRTVLFVSHNMQSITRLCPRVILVDGGKILQDGPSHEAVSAYLDSGMAASAAREWPDPAQAPGGEVARLRAVRVRSEDGQIAELTDIRRPVRVEMEYDVLQPGHVLMAYYDFYNEEGLDVFSTMDLDPAWRGRPRPQGRWVSTVVIPGNLLAEGTLFVGPGVMSLTSLITQFQERDVVAFHVVDSHDGDSARGDWAGKVDGVIRPLLSWNTQLNPKESQSGAISIKQARAIIRS
jgi:lipopolysaccharide transport system ATP-binding protein